MTELKFLKKQFDEAIKEWYEARKEGNKEEAEYWQAQAQEYYARIMAAQAESYNANILAVMSKKH